MLTAPILDRRFFVHHILFGCAGGHQSNIFANVFQFQAPSFRDEDVSKQQCHGCQRAVNESQFTPEVDMSRGLGGFQVGIGEGDREPFDAVCVLDQDIVFGSTSAMESERTLSPVSPCTQPVESSPSAVQREVRLLAHKPGVPMPATSQSCIPSTWLQCLPWPSCSSHQTSPGRPW